jgi:NAD(P)-dependent dehydrogenase (short-subunit alcohol dehydrogenase family)
MSSEQQVAIVTGANRGAGRAIADALAVRGYRVCELNRTLAGGVDADEWLCDLADPAQLVMAVGEVLDRYGRVDVCVANAVDRVFDPIAELSVEDWDRLVAINLSSVFRLIKAVLPALRESGGTFVAMGSHAASRFFEGGAVYSATKAALKPLVETLLLEERHNGVRACLVSPGAIANLAGDDSPHKMSVASVGECVATIAHEWPRDLVVGEIEIRPASLPAPPVTGLDRLQHV